jgi:glycosyltransferase involved in cell wall biosynthesis
MADQRTQTRVLLISHDVIGQAMAGPGIRYYHLARELAPHVRLTVAVRVEEGQSLPTTSFVDSDVTLVGYQRGVWNGLAPAAQAADVIILPTDTTAEFPQLAELSAALVIDGYDPLLAEWLALFHALPEPERSLAWRERMTELHRQYLVGDLYLCASERQRYWWLGQLEATGRLHPATFSQDRSLHNLVEVVPYGLRTDTPHHTADVVRGVWPGIDPDDKLVLWGGGLWPWLDPVSAIRAIDHVWQTRQDVKLLFPGTQHPNPAMQGMPTQNDAAFACADELGLRDRAVFFGDWIPYAHWPSLLLECDVALTLHFDTVETQLAFRSRLFDYIWAGLPTVATRGDATSDLVNAYDIGQVVDYEDDAQVAAAILNLLDEEDDCRRTRFDAARAALTWQEAAAPLLAFCRAPRRAPDRLQGMAAGSPYYAHQTEQDAARIAELEALVEGYAGGRVMRALDGLGRWRNRLTGGRHG